MAPLDPRQDLLHVRMIHAEDSEPVEGDPVGELHEGFLHVRVRAVVIEVLGVDVRDDGDGRREAEERAVALVGLGHEQIARAQARVRSERVHFAAVSEEDSPEDWGNLEYLRDTAIQAGWSTVAVPIDQIGHAGIDFVDQDAQPIECLFKLYPWEWMAREEFGVHLPVSHVQFIEPPWKMLLSNKALVVILWELFPDHPNLLPAYYDPAPLGARYARKPKLAREGANVTLVNGARIERSDGPYDADDCVFQALAPLPRFGDDHVSVGSWIVNGEPAGIGLREDESAITRNTSRFVPHYFT